MHVRLGVGHHGRACMMMHGRIGRSSASCMNVSSMGGMVVVWMACKGVTVGVALGPWHGFRLVAGCRLLSSTDA